MKDRKIALRRKLRRNSTQAELKFWQNVRNKQILNLRFRKQHSIGNYIVDFYCPNKKLIIEIDGDTHSGELSERYDNRRTAYLVALGYNVIRYNNRDVLTNIEGVFADLITKLNYPL